jgi:hypothetical protein
MYRSYRFRQSSGGDGGATLLLLLLMMLPVMATVAYVGYKKYKGEDPFDFLGGDDDASAPVFEFEMVDGVPQFTKIEPSDCRGSEYVKKKSCHNKQTGKLLDGTTGNCGDGVEEWVLDPNAPGYQRALGNGKCESDFRPCNVVCDKPCEGDTWIEGPCMRDGVVLDGSNADKCGQGMREYTLDENASDYKPAQGKGTCTIYSSSACHVECPPNVVELPACVDYTTWQPSGNKCVVSKEEGAAPVGYDEPGWHERYQLALEPEKCTGEKRLVEWKTCTGPPAPVDCVGTWKTSDSADPDGWGPCVGACGTQPTQSRTYKVTTDASPVVQATPAVHGAPAGAACPYSDDTTETRNCGSIQPCCEVGEWQDGTCRSDGYMTKTRTLTENKPGGCATYDSEKEVRCCYEAGDWEPDGQVCGHYQTGKMKYKQTVAGNCDSGTDTKYEDCQNCVQKGQISDKTYCVDPYASYYSPATADRAKIVHAIRRVTITPASGGGIECIPEYTLSGGRAAYSDAYPERQSCSDPEELQNAYNAGYPGVTWSDCGNKFCSLEMYYRNN